ncbi:arginine--tRNA ligase [Cuniculiplasma sp. SKW3]|uniref:arginine--tRNA ligase n=1 Tax=unclassified Cuniculiplasma TaxID=2619706 RepID=UPI003FD485E4
MLLFQDMLELIRSGARKYIDSIEEKEVIFDPTEHAHITLRLIKYSRSVDNFDSKVDSICHEIEGMKFVKSVKREGAYINVNLDPLTVLNTIAESIETAGIFPDSFQDPERISVEHTSTNPTGPIHMGRVRNSIIGDSVARLIARYGYRVTTQYYVNDSGKQMLSLYLGYRKFHDGEKPTVDILLDGYIKVYNYFEKEGSEKEVEDLMERYEKGDEEIIKNVREIATVVLNSIVEDLAKLQIKFDEFTWESEFITTGETKEVMKRLSSSIETDPKDGAKYIDIPDLRKIYLERKNGTSLYVTRDIAYHMYKFSQYDRCIVILGEDHREHGKIMDYIMHNLLEYKNQLDFLFYGYVNLESGKMSTRKGTSIPVRDVYEKLVEKAKAEMVSRYGSANEDTANKIASSSLRFYLVKINPSKPITFRWEDALDFNGETAPFIMYSYTRAASIMDKANNEKGKYSDEQMHDSETDLIVYLYQYPYKMKEAYNSLKPEILANYLLVLSKKFTRFYENCRVLDEEESVKNRRLNIIGSYMNIVEDCSNILGIQNVRKM